MQANDGGQHAMSDDKRDEWEICTPSAERGYGDNHHWRWDRARCEMCGLELDDYVAKSDNARTQLEERVRDLEALAQEKATQVYISWREKTYELVEVFVKCPHCHREEILGDGSASYPKNPPAVIANFKHADNCWLTRFTALLSPQECSGTEGEGK